MASLSVHRFDRALAYDVFSYCLLSFFFLIKIKKIKKLGEFGGFFFCRHLLDIACILARYLNSVCIDSICLDIIENFDYIGQVFFLFIQK
jgi:hypothetical protein